MQQFYHFKTRHHCVASKPVTLRAVTWLWSFENHEKIGMGLVSTDQTAAGTSPTFWRQEANAEWYYILFYGRMTLFLHLFLFYTIYTFIYNSFIHKHSLWPISISSQLSAQWSEPPWCAEPRIDLGPASQRTTNWATLHPTYLILQSLLASSSRGLHWAPLGITVCWFDQSFSCF